MNEVFLFFSVFNVMGWLTSFICFSVSVVSCEAPSDHCGQTISRIWHIWKVWLQCAYDSGVLAHRSVQISIRIQAIDMNKVFHLNEKWK